MQPASLVHPPKPAQDPLNGTPPSGRQHIGRSVAEVVQVKFSSAHATCKVFNMTSTPVGKCLFTYSPKLFFFSSFRYWFILLH
jgi:hypothetical protein